MKNIWIKGSRNGREFERTQKFPNTLDGYFLDKLEISATIESFRDIDELITFLKIHRPCFITPENVSEAYPDRSVTSK